MYSSMEVIIVQFQRALSNITKGKKLTLICQDKTNAHPSLNSVNDYLAVVGIKLCIQLL